MRVVESAVWFTSRGGRSRESGQSLPETAMMLPLLLLLVMGIIDLGFVLYAHVQVAAACGAGARVAAATVLDGTAGWSDNRAALESAVRDAVEAGMGTLDTAADWSKTSDVTFEYVTQDPLPSWYDPDSRRGDYVIVRVQYRQPVFFEIIPGRLNQKVLVSSATRVRLP